MAMLMNLHLSLEYQCIGDDSSAVSEISIWHWLWPMMWLLHQVKKGGPQPGNTTNLLDSITALLMSDAFAVSNVTIA